MASFSIGRLTIVVLRYFNKEQQESYYSKGFSRKTTMVDWTGEYDGITLRTKRRQYFFGLKRKKPKWPLVSEGKLPVKYIAGCDPADDSGEITITKL